MIGWRSSAVAAAAGGACTATGSTSQTSDSRSWRSARRRAASADPASRWSATRARSSADARAAVLAITGGIGETDGVDASRVERGHVAAVGVVQVGAAAGHPRPEVGADGAEYDDDPAGHVFAAVLAEALDDRLRAGVAHGEPHPGPADEVQPPAGRAVEAGVAGDRLAGGVGGEVRLRGDDEPPARQALADVVVRLADQPQLERRTRERAERLAGRAAELQTDRPAELAALERARQRRPERPVGRREPQATGARTRPGRRARRRGSSRAATRAGGGRRVRRARASRGGRRRQSRVPRPRPRRDRSVRSADRRGASRRRLSPTTSPTDRAPAAASSRRKSSARASANRSTASGVPLNFARRSSRWVAIPVGHVSRWHWRAMSQPRATSIAVPNANSSAPSSAATSRSRPVLSPPSVRSATRSRSPFRSSVWWTSASPSSHGAPTCLIDDSGDAPVPPAWPLRCTYERAGLHDAGRDRPDAARRDELHADPRRGVDRPQVRDQLGEVLDRVDVVVRRRADVRHRGLAAPEHRDVGGRLLRRQLAALAGLAALGDLDLELVGAREVLGGDAEAGRRDLLDPGVVALARRGAGCTRRGPRRPRRCSRRRRRAGCRSSAPGGPPARAPRPTSPTRRSVGRCRGRARRRRGRRRPTPRRGGFAARRGRPTRDPPGPTDSARGRRRSSARRPTRGRRTRRRSAARTGGPRRRLGSGRTRDRAGGSTACRRRSTWRRRRVAARARRGRPARSSPATPARRGSSGRGRRRRARSTRTGARRCTRRSC